MKQLLTAVLFAVVGTVCLSAQTAENIIAKSIAATRTNTMQSIRLQGVATEYERTSGMKIECRNDGKALITTTSNEVGVTVFCWYGGGGWVFNEMASGQNKLPLVGSTEYTPRNIAAMSGMTPRLDKVQEVELSGDELLNGTPVYTLRAVFGVNDTRTIYIRKDNFLPLRETRNEPNQGKMDVVLDYADFQTINGVTLPRKITKSVAGKVISLYEFTSIEINISLPDAMFSSTGVYTR